MDPEEQEEHFYRLAGGNLSGQSGYYIYYEKNEAMQNFMVRQHQKEPETEQRIQEEEKTVAGYRARMQEKQRQIRPKAEHSILCAAGVLTAMAACVIGITTINNYEKMAGMQDAIQVLSQSAAGTTEKEVANFEVEDMQSSIKPLEEQADPVAVSAQAAQTSQAAQASQTPQVTSESVEVQASQPETTGDPAPASVDGAQPTLSEAETYKLQGYYIVEKGDSLAVISQKIYQNKDMVSQICAKNGIADENTIYIGQKLLLP